MIKLGHIDYSNCLPLHALLLETPRPEITIVPGIPSELNQALRGGTIDVAPCSSIEYARNAGVYRVLPRVVIGSFGPVQSILLESSCPLNQLNGRIIAVTNASATSVVLLRVLLETRFAVKAVYEWFTQSAAADPIAGGAAAALWIGDTALQREPPARHEVYDLGALWTEWTGLPFAFALWQTRLGPDRDDELRSLMALLEQSREQSLREPAALAARHAARLGLEPRRLTRYWESLRFDLDHAMLSGLLRFYQLAADLGECPQISSVQWADV